MALGSRNFLDWLFDNGTNGGRLIGNSFEGPESMLGSSRMEDGLGRCCGAWTSQRVQWLR
jgi:hypothetical protein